MNNRADVVARAAEGRLLVQESVWRGWASEVLEIYSQAGYSLKHVSQRREGDKSYTMDTTYDFIFEKAR
jgi:hypothetical protein